MINTLQYINECVRNNPVKFINDVEREYNDEISRLARRVADNDDIRLVAIAGPSGSGKTTTAALLASQLEMLGEKTAAVSLDDFYLPADKAPVLADGSRDTESVNALDIGLMRKCFRDVVESGRCEIPEYEFRTSSRTGKLRTVDVGKRGIVIVEGLHALNPALSRLVERKNACRVYISVNSPVIENGGVLLTSRAIRLMRRSLRDEVFRGTDINATLSMWQAVGEGEKKYLFPYKSSADVILKTLHLYEPCVYKKRFVALREQVDEKTPCREYFMRVAAAAEKFEEISGELVPPNSLLREFIGK